MKINEIYNEPCLDTLGKMPDKFVDCVVTSPPYDDLREYNGYSFPFEDIAKELFRVIKEGGVLVWVVGDAVIDGSESGTSFKQALFLKEVGFNLHDTMIYEKNGAAYPANDNSIRYSQTFEYMFVFAKGRPKTINLIKDKKNRWVGSTTFGRQSHREKDGTITNKGNNKITQEYGYRTNIWRYNNGAGYSTKDEIAFKHPAIFPELLAADHIKTWTNENDLVYDCFSGSGTTIKMAALLNRNWIGSEMSKEYCDISNKRLKPYLTQTQLF